MAVEPKIEFGDGIIAITVEGADGEPETMTWTKEMWESNPKYTQIIALAVHMFHTDLETYKKLAQMSLETAKVVVDYKEKNTGDCFKK